MLAHLRPRLTYANVIATVAVFLALGGGAYAVASLPKNSVGTKQLKKSAVTNPKLAKNAVTRAKVKPGSLTGIDIKASTLGLVPNASHANNATNANHSTTADALGKVRVVHADFRENANTAERDLFSAGGLKLSASCDSSGHLNFKWTSLVDHSTFRDDVVGGSTNASTSSFVFDAGNFSSQSVVVQDIARMTVVFSTPAGSSVTGQFMVAKTAFNSTTACVVTGDALVSSP